jgi:hypothetical protein
MVGYRAEDGGSMFLQTVGIYLQIRMVSQPTGIHRLENYVAVFKVIAFTREFQRI